jgi:vacuolar-type H+-ATPase subunit E/Vma4
MKGSALLETMTAQVMEKCESTRSAAQQEADVILADAKAQGQAQRESVEAQLAREMDHLDERWEQMAHAEASRADLTVKNDAVSAVLDVVQTEIRRIVSSSEFGTVLDALLTSLMQAADGDIVVLGPESHLDRVKKWLADNGHGGVKVEASPEMWDGVAIQDPAQTYRVSNTLSGRYHRIEETARKQCMSTMFGEGV